MNYLFQLKVPFQLLIVVTLLLVANNSSAQESVDYERLDSFTNVFCESIRLSNIEVMTAMTHPDLVKSSGGPEFVASDYQQDIAMYNSLNLPLTALLPKTSSKIISHNGEWQAVIPYVIEDDHNGIKIEENHYFLAASIDEGHTWYFVDMKKYDPQSIKVFVPNYNKQLDIFFDTKG